MKRKDQIDSAAMASTKPKAQQSGKGSGATPAQSATETFKFFDTPKVFRTMWKAIAKGHFDTAEQLLRDNPSWINVYYTDTVGYHRTLLHEAVRVDNVAAARFLVEHGHDVDATPVAIYPLQAQIRGITLQELVDLIEKNPPRGITPLHFAAWHSRESETVRFLVEAGADINKKGDLGWTPLHLALMDYPDKKIAAYLISAGADIGAKDDDGWAPINLLRQLRWHDLIQSCHVKKGKQQRKKRS
jgi:ankyrin repeat protein